MTNKVDASDVATLSNDLTNVKNKVNALLIPFINTSEVLYTQSAKEFTYTATQDCVVVGTMETAGTASAEIKINNMRVGGCYSGEGDVTSSIFLPLKKGQNLSYASNKFNSLYPIRVFGLLS